MRFSIWTAVLLATLMAVSGCSWFKKSPPAYETPANPPVTTHAEPPAPVVALADGLNGKISSVNSDLRFVVITFPVGQMARVNQHLSVYRNGMKVGELTVTGPQSEDSTVADVTAGEAQVGDAVRDR
ncbi:MAG TPA: hypothetical protein VFW05_14640 [Verrucomicrobiae bacterium]|nr:hypothetical protein [Verrucomicrobiae bacterium]